MKQRAVHTSIALLFVTPFPGGRVGRGYIIMEHLQIIIHPYYPIRQGYPTIRQGYFSTTTEGCLRTAGHGAHGGVHILRYAHTATYVYRECGFQSRLI